TEDGRRGEKSYGGLQRWRDLRLGDVDACEDRCADENADEDEDGGEEVIVGSEWRFEVDESGLSKEEKGWREKYCDGSLGSFMVLEIVNWLFGLVKREGTVGICFGSWRSPHGYREIPSSEMSFIRVFGERGTVMNECLEGIGSRRVREDTEYDVLFSAVDDLEGFFGTIDTNLEKCVWLVRWRCSDYSSLSYLLEIGEFGVFFGLPTGVGGGRLIVGKRRAVRIADLSEFPSVVSFACFRPMRKGVIDRESKKIWDTHRVVEGWIVGGQDSRSGIWSAVLEMRERDEEREIIRGRWTCAMDFERVDEEFDLKRMRRQSG
ncbi:hypothetical protein Tco_0848249, partial [Tanacetum coccineum]